MKKLLRDAWRAITGNMREPYPLSPGKESDSLPRQNAELAAVDAEFDDALHAQQAGSLPEAQAIYRRILGRIPAYAPALHFLGVSYYQTGDLLEAERLIRRSIEIWEVPEYFRNLALVLSQQGKQQEAMTAYRDVLRLAPEDVLTYCNLGDLLTSARQYGDAEQAYRAAFTNKPDDAEIAFKLGATLAVLKRTTEAADAYRKALTLRPDYVDAYNNLANLLKEVGKASDAEYAYRQALSLQPNNAAVQCNLGQLLQDLGRYSEAETAFGQALDAQPNFAVACNCLGNLYVKMDRYPDALEAYHRALALHPDYIEALCNVGLLLTQSGRFDEAEAAFRKALSLKAGHALTYFHLANLLRKTNRIADAESAYRKALDLDPDYADACSNLGSLLQEDAASNAESEALHRKAILLNPDSAQAHYNYGRLLLDARRFAEAEETFRRVIILQPDMADGFDSLGSIFKETGRFAEAEGAYRRAIALNGESPGAHTNLGLLLHGAERFAEAEASYRRALALAPENDLTIYNFALFCLSQKRFQEGWKGYERRWKMKDFNALRHQTPQAQWQGEPLGNETMVVWQEQGVGDVVLYAGMIPDLILRGAPLILECEARLVPLLARSFPAARVVMRSDQAHASTFDAQWQSPLGSLCRFLRNRGEDFLGKGPYLAPDVAKVSEFKKRYIALGPGPVVGISWRSNNYKVGARKSISLLELAPLIALGATFVNLQYGDCTEELSRFVRDTGITIHHDHTVDSLRDLDSFAAQVASMDLVISTSNSTVHFAGALGVPVWTLLPRGGDALLWYWFNEGEQSLWYPSMRLFRQDGPGDWPGLIARVTKALADFLENRSKEVEFRILPQLEHNFTHSE